MSTSETTTQPTILIDVDGTLSASLPGIQAGLRDALTSTGHPIPDEAFMSTIAGPPLLETLERIGLDDEQQLETLAAYRAHQEAGGWSVTHIYDGWPGLLKKWRNDGIRLATATSKGHRYTRKTLELFGILDLFDVIGSASDDGARRAKDDVIEYTLGELGLPAERLQGYEPGETSGSGSADALHNVIMIGDRSHDIAGAHVFGIRCVAAAWGYGTAEEWDQADAVALSPDELDSVVQQLLLAP